MYNNYYYYYYYYYYFIMIMAMMILQVSLMSHLRSYINLVFSCRLESQLVQNAKLHYKKLTDSLNRGLHWMDML